MIFHRTAVPPGRRTGVLQNSAAEPAQVPLRFLRRNRTWAGITGAGHRQGSSKPAGWVLLETLPRPCGVEVDSAPVQTCTVRGSRLTLGRRRGGWIRSFMVSSLQPVFVFQPQQTRLPGGKVRRGPALRLLAGKGGLVLPSQLILQSFMVSPLQPVFVFQPQQTRLPGGKVRRGPARVALVGGRRGKLAKVWFLQALSR